MDFRVNKYIKSRDPIMGTIRGEMNNFLNQRLCLRIGHILSGTGDGADSRVYVGLAASPSKWRVVAVGGWFWGDATATIAEKVEWGMLVSDAGATDSDAFGSFVMDTTAAKNLVGGDVIYQSIAPFENFFNFDTPTNAGSHTWDIGGTGAGLLMGDWQTKAAMLVAYKSNVASSTGTLIPFMLIEYDIGGGVQ
jgi:hypothetical protein